MNAYEERIQAYSDWLASLKVGDTVCYSDRYHGYNILTIEKITPTRQIKTNKGYTFREGYYRGTDTWSSGIRIEQYTQKIANSIREKSLMLECKKIKFDTLTADQLEAILKITGGYIQPKEEVSDPNQLKLEL